jgi:hypothetical protein
MSNQRCPDDGHDWEVIGTCQRTGTTWQHWLEHARCRRCGVHGHKRTAFLDGRFARGARLAEIQEAEQEHCRHLRSLTLEPTTSTPLGRIASHGFTCPLCQRTTHHPDDIANRYCPCCGGPWLPRDCPHQPFGGVTP